MSFHVGELSQFTARINKLGNFMNCQNFSPKIQKFPGIPGNSRTGIPGGLDRGGFLIQARLN